MKAKFKISQLAAVDTKDVELIHPTKGETGIVFKLAGPIHSVWKEALKVFRESEQDADANLNLLASTILSWDDEAMEAKYSQEAVHSFLSKPEHEWAVHFISNKILDNETFFR